MTQKQQLEAALAARGYAQVAHASGKYTKWTKQACASLYVGTSGALRIGSSASQSSSLSDRPIHATLLAEGKALLERPTVEQVASKYA